MNLEVVRRIAEAFAAHGVRYAVVGGVAINLHGLIRATEDVDFFVDTCPENVGRIKAALGDVFDDPSIDEIQDGEIGGAYATVRYGPPEGDFYVDLIGRLEEAFSFDDIETQELTIGMTALRVATPAMLYRMKRDAVRPKDRADAEALRRRFGLEGE